MKYNINHQGNKMVVSLSGSFLFSDAVEYKKILSAFDKSGITAGELNLQKLDHIDSSGLGLLIKTHDLCRKHGYKVAITGVHGAVQKILTASKMSLLFDIS